jgi:hypothetical protein
MKIILMQIPLHAGFLTIMLLVVLLAAPVVYVVLLRGLIDSAKSQEQRPRETLLLKMQGISIAGGRSI